MHLRDKGVKRFRLLVKPLEVQLTEICSEDFRPGSERLNIYFKLIVRHSIAEIIAPKESTFNDAPPIKPPSIFLHENNSFAFSSEQLPP